VHPRASLLLAPAGFALLLSCGGGDDTSGGQHPMHHGTGDVDPVLTISAPEDGAVLVAGEPVEIRARIVDTISGHTLKADVTWTSGDWSFIGATGTVTDLPQGEIVLLASATYDDEALSDSVAVSVGAASVSYSGRFMAGVKVESDFPTYEGACPGDVAFTIDRRSTMSGAGSCTIEGNELPFTLSGTMAGTGVSGQLAMDYDGNTFYTPFTGSEDHAGVISAAFTGVTDIPDYNATVTIDGTFDGQPQ
jgi:hypothetical protein